MYFTWVKSDRRLWLCLSKLFGINLGLGTPRKQVIGSHSPPGKLSRYEGLDLDFLNESCDCCFEVVHLHSANLDNYSLSNLLVLGEVVENDRAPTTDLLRGSVLTLPISIQIQTQAWHNNCLCHSNGQPPSGHGLGEMHFFFSIFGRYIKLLVALDTINHGIFLEYL